MAPACFKQAGDIALVGINQTDYESVAREADNSGRKSLTILADDSKEKGLLLTLAGLAC